MATRRAEPCLRHVVLADAAAAAAAGDPGKIGICHGRVGSNLPPPAVAVALLRQNGITKVRLFLPDPAVLPAFAAAGIDLMVGVPNENLTFLSSSGPEGALRWLRSSVLAHAPADRVRYLAVGNEALYSNQFYAPHLVPAMRNLHRALVALGLDGMVKVSSAHASSYPPSAGAFDAASMDVLRPMRKRFLADTGAPFMVNAPANVPLGGTCAAAPVRDGALLYTSLFLFDTTVDAVVAALKREGFGAVPVAVTETGWPTAGHPVATPQKAAAYNAEMAGRAARGAAAARRAHGGVPVRPVRRGRQARARVREALRRLEGGRQQGLPHRLCLEL